MAYWLVKSEPDDWSWAEQVAKGKAGAEWTGIRNHSAQNHLRAMRVSSSVRRPDLPWGCCAGRRASSRVVGKPTATRDGLAHDPLCAAPSARCTWS